MEKAGEYGQLANYFHGDTYLQHNPLFPDGVKGLLTGFEELARRGESLVITRRHRTVAEGEFVFVQSEGTAAGRPAAFWDLWRVSDGRLAEHWDVWFHQPSELPHGNGLF